MKKIIALMLVVILIVLSLPFINGLLMEKSIHNAVNNINSIYAETGVDNSLEIINYKRGFFTTEIESKLHLGSFKAVYGIEEVVFTEHANHGYTGIVSSTTFEKNPWFNAFIEEQLQGKNPFTLKSEYTLTGGLQSTLSLEAFSIDIEGEKLDVKEGNLVIKTDTELSTFQISGNWSGMNAADKVTMGKVAIASDFERASTLLWDGYVTYSLNSLKAVGEQGQLVCENLQSRYQLSVDQAKNKLSGELDFSADKLSLFDNDVNGAKMKIALNNLNQTGYEEFVRLYMEMLPEIMTNLDTLEEGAQKGDEAQEKKMAAISLKMAAAYEKLFRQGVEFQIKDLLVKLPEGDISADITLGLLKDMTLMQLSPVAMQPALALDLFHLQSDIRVPAALVGEVPLLVEPSFPGMQTGIFIKNGEYLTHRAETKDGKLFLNEKEFVLEQ